MCVARSPWGLVGDDEAEHLRAGVGAVLREARLGAGFTAAALARAVGCAGSTPCRIEAGTRRPRPGMLFDFAQVVRPHDPQSLMGALVAAAGPSLRPDTAGSQRRRDRGYARAERLPVRRMAAAETRINRATSAILNAIGSAVKLDELAAKGAPYFEVMRYARVQFDQANAEAERVAQWPHRPLPPRVVRR